MMVAPPTPQTNVTHPHHRRKNSHGSDEEEGEVLEYSPHSSSHRLPHNISGDGGYDRRHSRLACNLALADGLVSRKHAILHVGPDTVVVEDLGSRNGVAVNGRNCKLLRHQLRDPKHHHVVQQGANLIHSVLRSREEKRTGEQPRHRKREPIQRTLPSTMIVRAGVSDHYPVIATYRIQP